MNSLTVSVDTRLPYLSLRLHCLRSRDSDIVILKLICDPEIIAVSCCRVDACERAVSSSVCSSAGRYATFKLHNVSRLVTCVVPAHPYSEPGYIVFGNVE